MTADAPAAPPVGGVMTFREHLRELRSMLVRITLMLIAGFFFCWEFRVEIFDFLSHPIAGALADNGVYHFQAIQITESVLVYLKTALIADIALLSPLIFWQLWSFIGPGLYKHEKNFVLPLTAFSVVFFMIGASFSYSVLLPFVTDWLIQLTQDSGNVEVLVTLQNAYSFAFTFLLMFGLVFELPLVIFFLALWGTATGKGLLKFWRYFAVLSFLISAILTPPDPLSQLLMAIPLNVLYGFGIIVAMTVSRARKKDKKHVGAYALKMMGLAIAGAVAVGVAVLFIIAGIPDRSLLAYSPSDTAWTSGVNPRAMLKQEGVAARLAEDATIAKGMALLEANGVTLSDVTDAVVSGHPDGSRAVLLRADGAGLRAAAIRAALAPKPGVKPGAMDLVAAQLDDNTLVIGHRTYVRGILAVAFEEAPATTRGVEDGRLLKRLQMSGPLWSWLPSPAAAGDTFLGADGHVNIGHAGAVLSLGERARLSLHLRAADIERTAPLDAQISLSRDRAQRIQADSRQARVVDALRRMAGVLERTAPSEEKRELRAIVDLLRDGEDDAARASIAAMTAAAPFALGWSVTRNDQWFTVTSELELDALSAYVRWLAGS